MNSERNGRGWDCRSWNDSIRMSLILVKTQTQFNKPPSEMPVWVSEHTRRVTDEEGTEQES